LDTLRTSGATADEYNVEHRLMTRCGVLFRIEGCRDAANSKGELRNQREPVVGEGAVGPILNKRSDIEGNPAPLVSQQHRPPSELYLAQGRSIGRSNAALDP
jgi:hypothetical protein